MAVNPPESEPTVGSNKSYSNIPVDIKEQKIGDSQANFSGGPDGDKKSILKLREIDKDNHIYGLYLRHNTWLESPAYSEADDDSNGFIGILRLNNDNKIEFGTAVSILENIELPDDPGEKIPVIDMSVTDSELEDSEHSYSFRINYNSVFSIFGIADGLGNIKRSGVKIEKELVFETGDPYGINSMRIFSEGGYLKFQKFDSEEWIDMVNMIPSNAFPKPLNLHIEGTQTVGNSLTVMYDYYSPSNIAEGVHTYQWYQADDINGTNAALIPGATGADYTLTSGDAGKYITCELALKSDDPEGNPLQTIRRTSYIGPVS